MDRLYKLSALVAERNEVSASITSLIGRPAQLGHIGEFIASELLGVTLELTANNKGFDGRFSHGQLVGKTVDVKTYAKRERIIDLRVSDLPDYYLVLSGPVGPESSSKGQDRPWLLSGVHLFNATELIATLQSRGLRVGVATSVARSHWDVAEVYPRHNCHLITLNDEQRAWLSGFGKPGLTVPQGLPG